jgi:Holliday junction resolvase RusA-like endonuclease
MGALGMKHSRFGTCDAPPSANESYANKRGGGRITTGRYRDWQQLAWMQLKPAPEPVESPVKIEIHIGKCNQARDLDNFAKPTIDLLKKIRWIKDDNLLHVTWVDVRKRFGIVPDGKIEIAVITDCDDAIFSGVTE